MAKIYLDTTDTQFTVANNNTTVVGSTGTENIVVNTGVTGTVVDSTVEQVDFAGAMSGYTFAQGFGENITVKNAAGTTIATMAGVAGKTFSFSDGTVALTYASSIISVGGTAITTTAAAVTPVTIDATNVSSATGGSSTPTTAQAFTLTTASNSFTGGTGADTFSAVIDQATPANSTITAADVLDGGAGIDTLNVTGVGTTLDVFGSALVSNIEIVNIRATTANSIDASLASGITEVNANLGAGTVLVTNLATSASIGIRGNGTVVQGEVAFAPATAAAAITLNVMDGVKQTEANDGVTAAATIAAANATGTATTATINSTGAANITGVVDLAAATLTSVTINATTNLKGNFLSQATDQVAAGGVVTISGAASSVELTAALDDSIATIDASGLTAGGLTATLGGLVTQTVTGGAGDDVLTTAAVLTTGSVNAGAGTDTLVLANVAHANTTALAAKYTNFETLSVNGTFNAGLISGITGVILSGGTNVISGLTATQAANVTAAANLAGTTLALGTATGTADVLTVKMGSGLTNTAATTAGNLTVTGFETVNIATNEGATATVGASKTTTIGLFATATDLTTVNFTGSAAILTSAVTTKAVTVNATALTGDGATTTLGLTVGGGIAIAGSTFNGSAFVDNYTIAAEGSTWNGNAGNDLFSTTVAILTADGTTDLVLAGGDGTDTLTITGAATAVTDNQFTNVSGMEKVTLTSTATTSLTTGAAFNTAFASGATITTGSVVDTTVVVVNAGLSTVNTTIVVDGAALLANAAGEDVTLTTGSGTDTVTFTGTAWVGAAAGDSGTLAIDTGAGVDTITFDYGTMQATTTSQNVTINAGTGADIINKGLASTNSTTVTSTTIFTIDEGDSLTTAYDTITGFDISTATLMSDTLNFATAAVGTLATSNDSGTILTHSITAGIATFDDAATYATALVINSTNLTDVLNYLNSNTNANGVVAFTYDSDSSGTADATMVFHQGAVTDSLVLLKGVTTADAIVIGVNVAGLNDLHVS